MDCSNVILIALNRFLLTSFGFKNQLKFIKIRDRLSQQVFLLPSQSQQNNARAKVKACSSVISLTLCPLEKIKLSRGAESMISQSEETNIHCKLIDLIHFFTDHFNPSPPL